VSGNPPEIGSYSAAEWDGRIEDPPRAKVKEAPGRERCRSGGISVRAKGGGKLVVFLEGAYVEESRMLSSISSH
jgi:hypothetical protein